MAGVHLWSCVMQEKLKCWWLPLGVTDFPFQFSIFSIMYLNYFYRENKKLLVKKYPFRSWYPFRTETNVVAPRYWGSSHTGWRSMLPLLHHTPEQSMLIACYGPKPLRVGSSFSSNERIPSIFQEQPSMDTRWAESRCSGSEAQPTFAFGLHCPSRTFPGLGVKRWWPVTSTIFGISGFLVQNNR